MNWDTILTPRLAPRHPPVKQPQKTGTAVLGACTSDVAIGGCAIRGRVQTCRGLDASARIEEDGRIATPLQPLPRPCAKRNDEPSLASPCG